MIVGKGRWSWEQGKEIPSFWTIRLLTSGAKERVCYLGNGAYGAAGADDVDSDGSDDEDGDCVSDAVDVRCLPTIWCWLLTQCADLPSWQSCWSCWSCWPDVTGGTDHDGEEGDDGDGDGIFVDDEEKQVSGVDWSLSWERVGRGWDWRGERRFPSKIATAKTMILQNSGQRKTQVCCISSEKRNKQQY